MKRIETSKGSFVVINKTFESSFPLYIWLAHYYPKVRYTSYFKLSEITEKQARYVIGVEQIDDYLLIPMDWYRSKLKSLLKSHNIEITNNTYIFKV